MRIRAAGIEELPLLPDIERAAGQCFHGIGMPEIADDDPLPLEELARYQRVRLAWLAADGTDGVAAKCHDVQEKVRALITRESAGQRRVLTATGQRQG
ncbi:hypothetical protein GA0115240_161252 [Streptomyces sp. DvalAA-14]|uniref:hypothetical protein n=1 Tax=Streptomyces sp. DvalAA-14 TaxID=1839759 RepID=UPI00081B0B44|nr:hypothetical protein GA0115240_161252 [Streptomyces sp. DvalAA-14]